VHSATARGAVFQLPPYVPIAKRVFAPRVVYVTRGFVLAVGRFLASVLFGSHAHAPFAFGLPSVNNA
jgi:hypothetical protein